MLHGLHGPQQHDEAPLLVALVGPTAAGKTAAGIALAARLGGEIVSADAVAVYRGLDIGAAKPTREEQTRVRFHLIDVANPDEDFNVADYERRANEAIEDIRRRGRIPILVGGTGLYVRAVTSILSLPHVPPQPDLRARLDIEAAAQGTPALHARLARVDPLAASRIQANDRRRIVRALEVFEVTGRPLSSFHTPEGVYGRPRPNTVLFGLLPEPREALYRRIEARVDAMLAGGFVDEVRGLLDRGYTPAKHKAMQSLGYRHLAAFLSGETDLDTAVAELMRDTRRYAKRQIAWFGADRNLAWISLDETWTPHEVVEQVIRRLGQTGDASQPAAARGQAAT